jgi:hypothetical protein
MKDQAIAFWLLFEVIEVDYFFGKPESGPERLGSNKFRLAVLKNE